MRIHTHEYARAVPSQQPTHRLAAPHTRAVLVPDRGDDLRGGVEYEEAVGERDDDARSDGGGGGDGKVGDLAEEGGEVEGERGDD